MQDEYVEIKNVLVELKTEVDSNSIAISSNF